MYMVIPIALLVVVVSFLWWLDFRRSRPQRAPSSKHRGGVDGLDTVAAWPPETTRVMTDPERKAYRTLTAALPEHWVLAQVPLSRFMKVPTRNSYSEWLRRVGLMSADLLICDPHSNVLAVVDIRSTANNEGERARQRHARMDRVLQAAGIAVLVWSEKDLPSVPAARQMVLNHLGLAPTSLEAGIDAGDVAPSKPGPGRETADSPAQASPARRFPNAAAQKTHFDLPDVIIEQRDPPPSSWFDNLDSGLVPLARTPTPSGPDRANLDSPPLPPR